MMYPVLTKVRYEDLGNMRGDGRMFGVALFLSWVVGPALMFALAWLFLADQPAYRTGVIVVGLARCIAMVLIWNDLAGGDTDRAAVLVIFNAIFQVVAYALLGWFYLNALPDLLGLNNQGFHVGIWEIAPDHPHLPRHPADGRLSSRAAGGCARTAASGSSRPSSRASRRSRSTGCCSPSCCCSRSRADNITAQPLTVARIALPLLVYFAGMWTLGFLVGRAMHLGYPKTATMAFTVASNDFELAIAVAVGVWGASSGQALAGVVGPLIEVPVLVTLVYVALWLRRRWWPEENATTTAAQASSSSPAARSH